MEEMEYKREFRRNISTNDEGMNLTLELNVLCKSEKEAHWVIEKVERTIKKVLYSPRCKEDD